MTGNDCFTDMGSTGRPKVTFLPYRTDVLYRAITYAGKGNPLLTGFVYFVVEFMGVYAIGLITGQFFGKNNLPPMYTRVLDNISMGLLAPIGAVLLSNLYNSIVHSIGVIQEDRLISDEQMPLFEGLLKRLDKLYNKLTVVISALVIGLGVNFYNYFYKTDSWLGINGGITGLYGRIFVGFNFFIVALAVYKCGITIWALQRILSLDIKIRPFHPDKAGGLRSLGRLAIAVNYFVSLVVLFFTLSIIFDPFAQRTTVYVIIFILFYPLSVIGFFASLSKAHRRMAWVKENMIQRLDLTFEQYYSQLTRECSEGVLDISRSDELIAIRSLYEIADHMPVWPFDLRTLVRFGSTVMLPLSVFLINMVANSDSILYNPGKLADIFGFFKR